MGERSYFKLGIRLASVCLIVHLDIHADENSWPPCTYYWWVAACKPTDLEI